MKPVSRSERLDIRISPAAKHLLLSAAEARHKTLSEFVLDSALTEAENTLSECQRFCLDAAQWQAFQEALDAPARRHPRLERLLQEPGVFD